MTAATQTLPWVSLFNRPGFLALRDLPATLHVAGGRAALGGVTDGERFVSGASAPYGGIDLAKAREAPEAVVALVDELLDDLRRDGVRLATLRLPPAVHAPDLCELVQFALLQRGFRVVDADLASSVVLRGQAGVAGYLAALRSPARRALKHAAAEPFTVAEPEDWTTGWRLLEANRAARGWSLSLDLPYVERLREAFGAAIRLLELRHDGIPVAAALTLRVRPAVDFVFAWGDAGHALPRSPMNRLVLALVERAIDDGVEVLDLGTSTDPAFPPLRRVPNPGLCRFKASVGATPQVRYVLEGEL